MTHAGGEILIVGGYGEVGRRIAMILAQAHAQSVIVAGRNPDRASEHPATRIDVDDEASIDAALHGVELVVACVRQRQPRLLRAAVRRRIAYTSIAPPQTDGSALDPLRAEAERKGARVVLGAGIEPGISSVLARVGADRVGKFDAVETALLLGVGDAFGADRSACGVRSPWPSPISSTTPRRLARARGSGEAARARCMGLLAPSARGMLTKRL